MLFSATLKAFTVVLHLPPSSSVGGSSWLSPPLERRLEQLVEERDKLEKEKEKSSKKKEEEKRG